METGDGFDDLCGSIPTWNILWFYFYQIYLVLPITLHGLQPTGFSFGSVYLQCIFIGLEPLFYCAPYCLSGMFLFTFFCHWKPWSMRKYTPYYTTILFCLNGNQSQHLESMVLYKLCCKFLRKYCSSLSRFELYLVDCWINIISFFFFFCKVEKSYQHCKVT